MKKYKLTTKSKVNFLGVTLFQIECIADFKLAKKGQKGGWIEKESNLSGNAWVSGNAEVYGNARVYGDAWVSGNARVYGDAEVYGNARVYGDARVYGEMKSTRFVFTSNYIHKLSLSDNHISYGCEIKTVLQWEKWLKGKEEFETPRESEKFKIIELSLKLAIEQHKQLSE